MGILPQLFTLSGLSTELGHDRRYIARRLAGVPADGRLGRSPAWFLRNAIAALQAHKRRSNCSDDGAPQPPFGIDTRDHVDGLAAVVAVLALREISDVVARLVAAVSGDDDQIYLAALLAPEVLRGRLALAFEKSGSTPRSFLMCLPKSIGLPRKGEWSQFRPGSAGCALPRKACGLTVAHRGWIVVCCSGA